MYIAGTALTLGGLYVFSETVGKGGFQLAETLSAVAMILGLFIMAASFVIGTSRGR